MAWATPDDIKNLWQDKKPLPTDNILTGYIKTVESQVKRAHGAKVQGWIDDGSLDVDYIADTVSWIIIDYLQTDGKPYSSEMQSYFGAASRSVSYNTDARTRLRLSPADLEMFKPLDTTVNGTFFTASMAPDARHFPLYFPNWYYRFGWVYESSPGAGDDVGYWRRRR